MTRAAAKAALRSWAMGRIFMEPAPAVLGSIGRWSREVQRSWDSQFRPSEDGVTSVAFARATITDGACEGSVLAAPVNPLGLTPTIVTGTSFSLIDCPSTAGARAKSRWQNSSLITTTGSLTAVSSSIGWRVLLRSADLLDWLGQKRAPSPAE